MNMNTDTADRDELVADAEALVVLRALGPRNRMAKRISRSADGQYLLRTHDGRHIYHVCHARTERLSNILSAARAFARIGRDEFVIRGGLRDGLAPRFRRLLHAKPDAVPTLRHAARDYVIFDIDGAHGVLPWYSPGESDYETTVFAVEELVRELLPAEFHSVNGWFGFSGGHGVKPGMSLRLFFRLSRALGTEELKAWLGHLKPRGLDTSVFSPAQQILLAPPILDNGVTDPVLVRTGLITGMRNIVVVPEIAALEALHHARPTRRSETVQTGRADSGGMSHDGNAVRASRRKTIGYVNALESIGDGPGQGGIHNAILSTVGAWVRSYGPDADPTPLVCEIRRQLANAVVDGAQHSPAYINEQLAALPDLIRDVQGMESARRDSHSAAEAARMRAAVAADRALVRTTADEAAQRVRDAVDGFISGVPKWARRRDAVWTASHRDGFGRQYPAPGEATAWRRRGAIIVDPGVGKTEAVIVGMARILKAHPKLRIAYVVPAHKLADDIVRRLNEQGGADLAAVWRGLNQPDPDEAGATMCRRPADAELVQRAGGDLSQLCGTDARGYCPFHPRRGGSCAYVRQRDLGPLIWVVPAALLVRAVPRAMQRPSIDFEIGGHDYSATPPPFDLMILDEAPFLSWLGGFDGEGLCVPLAWLDLAQLGVAQTKISDDSGVAVARALAQLRAMLTAMREPGNAADDCVDGRDGGGVDFLQAAETLRNAAGSPSVDPMTSGEGLAMQLNGRVAAMEKIRAVQRLLRVAKGVHDGTEAAACLESAQMSDGMPAVRVRWREDIHPSWLDGPVLYLDATAKLRLAEQWLGKVEELVTARAAAPYMRIVQVDDRAFGYGSLIAGSDAIAARRAMGYQRRIGELMRVAHAEQTGCGLLVGPVALIDQMTQAGLVPPNWLTASYGALRGVDTAKAVSVVVVVSRQLPAPVVVEQMAQVVFRRSIKHQEFDWYPTTQAIRLMHDGTGRQAEIECHEDPDAEIIRWTICEAEVLQALGRSRGVRRGADNPVLAFVLNRVDLGHLPLAEL